VNNSAGMSVSVHRPCLINKRSAYIAKTTTSQLVTAAVLHTATCRGRNPGRGLMNTRRCSKCLTVKGSSDFHKGKHAGLHTYCKTCNIRQRMQHYRNNPAATRKNAERSRERNREFLLEYLRAHPCVDCGEADIVVLEFDHVSTKEVEVTFMVGRGYKLARIQAEIAKCEVVCANCHRRRTYRRRGSYRIAPTDG
jgi:hypothetical protein